jgi:hypothetical protein
VYNQSGGYRVESEWRLWRQRLGGMGRCTCSTDATSVYWPLATGAAWVSRPKGGSPRFVRCSLFVVVVVVVVDDDVWRGCQRRHGATYKSIGGRHETMRKLRAKYAHTLDLPSPISRKRTRHRRARCTTPSEASTFHEHRDGMAHGAPHSFLYCAAPLHKSLGQAS